jgi:aerobic-type carbon monoxide dehydrogenase small subunit (CoxS/CutS family)
VPVTLRVNGKKHELRVETRVTLLDVLRENLGLTGTKKGCDHGQCSGGQYSSGNSIRQATASSSRCDPLRS